ncbi:white collar 2 type of transcription factor [Marasmius crinis-equi]|uniref:White collar 2 type of transcription factor n=1 Tax=Marasmius crinis-equi TaxID=585013 RepID=A0ABR3F7J3_9AGAR
MSVSQVQATTSHKPSSPSTQTFEFTKRKRWADLLVTELADANLFILNSNFRILYCGAAVTELLGWREIELVDHDFGDIVGSDDRNHFRQSFDDSIQRGSELITYVRLRCNSPATTYPFAPVKEILFEIKGYPRFAKYDSFGNVDQFFFALAKPYLSKNTAMLNTVLELQLENEHLQRKLRTLKSNMPNGPGNSHYNPGFPISISSGQRASVDGSSHYYTSGMDGRANMFDATKATAGRGSFDMTGSSAAMGVDAPNDDSEDGSKKKKLKKSHAPEQYVCVTCGRTDSPEWRKGPLGPKTLCNACGLRWAKQMRKTDDAPADTSGDS